METTTTARKRTRNRRRTNESADVSAGAGAGAGGRGAGAGGRGRKKRNDSTKKIEDKDKHRVKEKEKEKEKEIITKPVIESTNPFFIAVCAPDTYKARIPSSASSGKVGSGSGGGSGGGSDDRERKSNMFLRQRNRNSMNHHNHHHNNNHNNHNNHPNRFIHHPLLQQSRELECVGMNTQNETTNILIEISNEELFPSLGKASTASTVSTKLNFKEMVMRNSAASASTSTSVSASGSAPETNETVPILPPPTYPRVVPVSHKSISSGNIFLAAFQKNHEEDNDNNDNDNNDNDVSESYKPFISSSVLIDTCDKKYDRLYSS